MTEKITKLLKENCKLVITTERESIKWTAWLEIHPKKIKYICDFTVDGNIVGSDVIQQSSIYKRTIIYNGCTRYSYWFAFITCYNKMTSSRWNCCSRCYRIR